TVTVEAQKAAGDLRVWSVSRRFSEFVRLREALEKLHPTCLLPVLPNKMDGANASWHRLTALLTGDDLISKLSMSRLTPWSSSQSHLSTPNCSFFSDPTASLFNSSESNFRMLPGAISGRRFCINLIEARRVALEIFLRRALEHPRLGCDPLLISFLCEDKSWRYSFKPCLSISA
ncbi:unnamed protein product, partial [Protopolystoma xenopodis]